MSQSLTPYQGANDPLTFVREIGRAIANSKMFSCDNESQGMVFALACYTQGCDPLSIPMSYHLMHGKLSLRADAMLGRLSKAGGSFQVIEHSGDAAEIECKYAGRICRERLSWEDAQEEPFVYQGKPGDVLTHLLGGDRSKLKLSTNYATPRRRMQHLWARVVSDAVRVVAPELVTGVYSPTETAGILIDEGKASAVDYPLCDEEAPAVPTGGTAQDVADAEDATFESSQVAPAEPVEEPERLPKAAGGQIKRITELFGALGVPGDAQLAALKKRGATDMGNLSPEGASDLIASLEGALAKRNEEMAGESKVDTAAVETRSDGPVDQGTVDQLRKMLAEASQQEGGANLGSRIIAKLQESGLRGLADLSQADAEVLRNAIAVKNIELFFAASLQGKPGN